jgi:RimJ/RimL family protein N-acetyltransferase
VTVLHTPRLRLIAATPESLRAELVTPSALGDVLEVDVPPSWPPELYDADAVRWTLGFLLAHPDERLWSLYYLVEVGASAAERDRLVGLCGFKGAPDEEGIVEIGYGVVAESRRRGFASEAVRALLAIAFADSRVRAVIAHTLPELVPSIGVLRATGFTFDGPGNDPQEPTAIRFRLTRVAYDVDRTAGVRGGPPGSAADDVRT